MKSFSNALRAGVILAGALFLQFVISSFLPGFLLFPAAVLYTATFLTMPSAFIIGILAGSAWEGLSPFPFGMYIFLFSSGMALVVVGMRRADERSASAHGLLAMLVLLLYTGTLCIFYIIPDYNAGAILLLLKDTGSVAAILMIITLCHASKQRWGGSKLTSWSRT